MHYTTIFVAALAAFTSVSALPAEADRDRDRDRDDIFRRGDCRSDRDDLYCGRGINEYSRYDSSSRYCRNDNVNKLFCAYRNQQEFIRQLAEEWTRIERCALDEYWDIGERRCECYRRRDRDGDRGRDGDRDGDRGRTRDAPDCKNGDIAFCARSEDEIITFQRENILCTRGNGNYVFCASTERGRAREKARDHFRKERNN
ncbi:hypothetical protein CPLU01_05772 [Colletotrichum plurivorum]|uniref:EC2 protein n=2 Tax=Colletotrichum orchidearum species complex TaxID=2707337 RepID=A0A8H6KLE8_9PEZI|nr:hypothetical protein CSOJ01_03146 [Colletotrichum sojae]KAF6833093.1 hypothetical protein CPLU01_05772 [Colletotrichum plurivorum]